MSDIQPWPIKGTREIGDFRIFKLRADHKVSPRNDHEMEFIVVECVNWVNIVALTTEGEFVMVQQYRHGSATVETEIPGGVMDPEDTDPVHTAIRELREESGYEGTNARVIGQVFSNPAIMNYTTYTVLIENCEKKHALELDPGEDLRPLSLPKEKVYEMVSKGEIRHSLVVAALFHYELMEKSGS